MIVLGYVNVDSVYFFFNSWCYSNDSENGSTVACVVSVFLFLEKDPTALLELKKTSNLPSLLIPKISVIFEPPRVERYHFTWLLHFKLLSASVALI